MFSISNMYNNNNNNNNNYICKLLFHAHTNPARFLGSVADTLTIMGYGKG